MRSSRRISTLLLAALLLALPVAAAPVRLVPAVSFWDGMRVLLARILPAPDNCGTMDPDGRCKP